MTMDHRENCWVRFVNGRMRERFGRGNGRSLALEPVPGEIVRHHSRVVRWREFGNAAGCRARDVKMGGRAIADTQIPETDSVGINTNHSKFEKFSPIFVQFIKSNEGINLYRQLLAGKLDRPSFTHDACSGKRSRILFSSALHTPRSVMSPDTRRLGVTSNP